MDSSLPGRAIVSGASGFVGRALAAALGGRAEPLRLSPPDWRSRVDALDWRGTTVFHLAARVHDFGPDDAAAFERDNVEKTRVLAESAGAGGARRLVFLSSIKVHGEETSGRPWRHDDAPAPAGGYAQSKWHAEQALTDIARRTGLEVAIVRSPLVLGPGAGGNVRSLLALADSPWPLPFATLDNRRALIDRDDLVRLLLTCATHTAAAGQAFLCAGPQLISTRGLVRALRRALGRAPRLFGLAPGVLEAGAAIVGQGARARRLTRSLEVDCASTTERVGWRPEVSIDESAAKMARSRREGP